MAKLRVHNIEPSTGTDVAFGTTGDTIAVSSDSLKLNTWKDSGGNTLFQSDGAGTLSNVNSNFSGSGPKLILSQTASNSASISFTSDIDSTYDKYMFVYTDINPATNTSQFSFQGNVSGESGYNETITSSAYHAYHSATSATALLQYNPWTDQAQGTSFQTISPNLGNEADETGAGILYLFDPSSTTFVKNFLLRSHNHDSSDNIQDFFVGGYFNVTGAITEIQFKMSSGNFDGTIKMYGVS